MLCRCPKLVQILPGLWIASAFGNVLRQPCCCTYTVRGVGFHERCWTVLTWKAIKYPMAVKSFLAKFSVWPSRSPYLSMKLTPPSASQLMYTTQNGCFKQIGATVYINCGCSEFPSSFTVTDRSSLIGCKKGYSCWYYYLTDMEKSVTQLFIKPSSWIARSWK